MLITQDKELLTRYTERAAMVIFCRETINPILHALSTKESPIPTEIAVLDTDKGKTERIIAKSMNDIRNLDKFFSEDGKDLDRCALDNIPEKTSKYVNYLMRVQKDAHKKKYRLIKPGHELDYMNLANGIIMVVRSMEWRHEAGKIVDPEVRQRVARLLERRKENEALARGVGHAKKHDEDVKEVLAGVFTEFQGRLNDTFFPPYTEQLPALPAGTIHPLAWLTSRWEDR